MVQYLCSIWEQGIFSGRDNNTYFLTKNVQLSYKKKQKSVLGVPGDH